MRRFASPNTAPFFAYKAEDRARKSFNLTGIEDHSAENTPVIDWRN
jgi:hypothetical protein